MPIDQITVLAPGLIGGSVARAAKARGAAAKVVIWARRAEVRKAIASQKWCDRVEETVEAAVTGSALVVIASPVDRIVPLAKSAASGLKSGAVVTDVGSAKGAIAAGAAKALGKKGCFVGAHPMAGSEKTGWENGSEDLFVGRTCFVTPMADTDSKAHRLVAGFWQDLGARVVNVDPALHDEIVAHISHLPQALASCLCAYLADQNPGWKEFAGGGLRDTTRIAGSDPQLWKTILEANKVEVAEAIRGFRERLGKFEKAIEAGNWEEVVSTLMKGREYRAGLR